MKIFTIIMLLGLGIGACAERSTTRPELGRSVVELEAVHTQAGYVRIDWRVRGGMGIDFVVQRRHAAQPWKVRATLSPDGAGRMTLEDTGVTRGEPYTYRVRVSAEESVFAGTVAVVVP